MNLEQIRTLGKLGVTASFVGSGYSLVKKKKKTAKDFIAVGVTNIVGTELIKSI